MRRLTLFLNRCLVFYSGLVLSWPFRPARKSIPLVSGPAAAGDSRPFSIIAEMNHSTTVVYSAHMVNLRGLRFPLLSLFRLPALTNMYWNSVSDYLLLQRNALEESVSTDHPLLPPLFSSRRRNKS